MLPLWWPRTACIYCGRRLPGRRWRFGVRQLLTCPDHDDLPALDPLLAAVTDATPETFRDVLLAMARSAARPLDKEKGEHLGSPVP